MITFCWVCDELSQSHSHRDLNKLSWRRWISYSVISVINDHYEIDLDIFKDTPKKETIFNKIKRKILTDNNLLFNFQPNQN